MRWRWLLQTPSQTAPSVGLFILRVAAGGMMLGHGWGKLSDFSEKSASFPDPVGLGSELTMGFAIFAEFFCSIAVMAGLLTRLAVIPLIITMGVAVFVFHAADPMEQKELPLMYLAAFSALLLTGAGRLSADAALVGGRG